MTKKITICLSNELFEWLEEVSLTTGIPKGAVIRELLERARAAEVNRPYLRLAGSVCGPRNLSSRRGFEGR